jgi:hypothetical protein
VGRIFEPNQVLSRMVEFAVLVELGWISLIGPAACLRSADGASAKAPNAIHLSLEASARCWLCANSERASLML